MDDAIRMALSKGQVIDITTTGRRSGLPRRIEIVFHGFDGHVYISGMPRADRRRSWLANLEADPHLILHLKRDVKADLSATARIITDESERRAELSKALRAWPSQDLEAMVRWSPLIEVTFDDAA
jgi:deazaflavin-dependent oxidoreductase (nitroreductase family)